MPHQTNEYAHKGENGQSVDQLSPVQSSSSKTIDGTQGIVINNKFEPLAKCSVLYLGTAISSASQRGIDAIQEPLSKRYPIEREVVRGTEAWLSIYDNGLQLEFVHDPSVVIFYPIHSLVYCAGVRYATRTETGAKFANDWRFVSLDSPEASQIENTRNPPLFAITFNRTRHLPAEECHCFVAKTKQAALALVQACFSAYQATESEQDCSKVPLYFKVNDDGSKNKEIDDKIYITPAPNQDQITDYQTSTEGAGFFYTTDRVHIDSWQLGEQHKHDSESHYGSATNLSLPYPRNRTPTISTPQPHLKTQLTSIPEQPSEPTVDPYAPAANLLRVERIKDANSGRDVFIRWLKDTKTDTQQVYPKPNYDYHVDFYIDDQPEKKLSNELQRLTVKDEHPKKPSHHERLTVKEEHSKKPSHHERLTTKVEHPKIPSHHERKKHKKEKYRNDATFEGHRTKKRSNKTHAIDNYQHSYSNIIIPSAPQTKYYPSAPQPTYNSPAPQTTYNSAAPQTTFYPSAPQSTYNSPVPETPYNSSVPQTTYNLSAPQTTYDSPVPQTVYYPSAPQTTYDSAVPQTVYYPSAPQTIYDSTVPQTTYYPSVPETAYDSTVPQATYYPSAPQTTYDSSAPETTYNFPSPPFNTFILDNSSSDPLPNNMNTSSPFFYHFA